MTKARKDAPRRYIVDGAGQRVLVGLTSSETVEFERLDSPEGSLGGPSLLQEHLRLGQNNSDERWLELYLKHERAWSVWMAESRARSHSLCMLN
ncbi:hypothetical protein FXB41_31205 [Bradyrhizobium canariense]|nr:hypothetical protein [Bradyrhizobium sp. WSM1253]EIG58388.1 hypothetical protein Bra1253DRAFT_03089 [Bradyrhizobium sp. WSM1253]MBW5439069.1 hypothetical protein [Bradyrhizobium canariense]